MNDPGISTEPASQCERTSDSCAVLQRYVERAAALLPSQGPITAFVFLNTLQALENIPFDDGVQTGAERFGCQPYLTEDNYREKLAQDRVHLDDLSLALRRDLKADADVIVGSLVTRHKLRLAMLQHPLRTGPTTELQWFVAETDALKKMRHDTPSHVRDRFLIDTKHWVMRDLRTVLAHQSNAKSQVTSQVLEPLPVIELIERFGKSSIERWSAATWEEFSLQALWRMCRNGMYSLPAKVEPVTPPIRHRDLLRQVFQVDTDELVHPVLIRFCAAYVDQGFANWSLPHRDDGFFQSFLKIYGGHRGPPGHWLNSLQTEIQRLEREQIAPEVSVLESLKLLGVPAIEWEEFIESTLLALRGWAGAIWQLEVRPDRQAVSVMPGTLLQFLAIRLILERLALTHLARRELQFSGPLSELRQVLLGRLPRTTKTTLQQRAFQIFQLAQVSGWSPAALSRLNSDNWSELITEIEKFGVIERRRIFHQAFERYLRVQTLDAFSVHAKRTPSTMDAPRFQTVFCLDTREESFRRHLEEVAPDSETFGAVGFFSVPMYYKGVADARYTALCPIVVRPRNWITEEVDATLAEEHVRRAKTRRALGAASHNLHVRSRSITGGALLMTAFGVLATVPLVARVLFPRLTSRIRREASRFVEPPQITRLRLERKSADPGPTDDGIGFSVDEMANMGERLLRDIGLTRQFARLVAFFGHGSFCLNNPHKSCYDCGACSGSAGAPNARALAAILNDARVRSTLATRGVQIPAETHFLGGLHNTSVDAITFFDVDRLPESHQEDFEYLRARLDEACERNAHERCRRFQSAPLDLSFADAKRHVEERSEDLAQTRPEFGNASNAVCFVGRRSRSRGLYLDRRCFMHSYDPESDDADCTILGRILGAVVPVCSGINLQYFFSYIDSPGWGCGTKLPHNVTSLLGVMDGAASDLRPGLPWQGVEIHEPVRLLMLIETSPEGIRKIMSRSEGVRNIVTNGWVQLALLDPHSNKILVYREDQFHEYEPSTTKLPQAPTSADWYRGWREHLEFAQIEFQGRPAPGR